ncbi:hypothetical protein [Limnobacter parvus]|uniref:Uncharacterized protein n=1 Tax=Limnobacter parvus TaxID=2939690 RepID=A0ABT1XJM6_9BURK|nr:hypothetical protein [Limnobacter parvus]MCR2746299.1 hypothetical protein [Limnobacter parvus]
MMSIFKTSICMLLTLTQYLILLPTTYAQVNDISEFARGDHVYMPLNSDLTHTLSQETSGMHQFEGSLVLTGKVEVFWYTWTLDEESEIRMKLEFIPRTDELEKIPLVLYPHEHFKLAKRLELNTPNEALAQIFGAKTAASIIKNQTSRSIEGIAEFSVYQTFIECDRRYFQATLIKFDAQSTAQDLAYQYKKRCGD